MQNLRNNSSKIYTYPGLFCLGKATDYGQKFCELFGSDIWFDYSFMRRGGQSKVDRFYAHLKAEIDELKNRREEDPVLISLTDFRRDEMASISLLREKRLISPLAQKKWKKEAESVQKFLHSFFLLTFFSPLLVPLTLTTLTARAALQRGINEVVLVEPDNPYQPSWKKLSILTLNIGLFESRIYHEKRGFFSSIGTKARGIGRFLRGIKPQSRVICLQGAYHFLYVKKHIVSRLIRRGYWCVFTVKPDMIMGMSPGLMTASQFPIKQAKFFRFYDAQHTIVTGVLFTTIELKKNKYILVANTRLSGFHDTFVEGGGDFASCRKSELKKTHKLIRKYCHESSWKIHDIILAGDLNIGPLAQDAEFPLTRSVFNPEYEDVVTHLLEGKRSLHFVDLTEGVEGTRLHPDSVTFHHFFKLLTVYTRDYLRNDPVYFKSVNASTVRRYPIHRIPPPDHLIEEFARVILEGKGQVKEFLEESRWPEEKVAWVENGLKMSYPKVIRNIFTFPDRTDGIFLSERGSRNLYLSQPAKIQKLIPISEAGILTDKSAIRVRLQPRIKEH